MDLVDYKNKGKGIKKGSNMSRFLWGVEVQPR